jgi:DNA polymerase-4
VELLNTTLGLAPDTPDTTPLPKEIRLAGISASGLIQARGAVIQPTLEDMLEEHESASGESRSNRLRDAEQAMDAVRQRYGLGAVSLGVGEGQDTRHRAVSNSRTAPDSHRSNLD